MEFVFGEGSSQGFSYFALTGFGSLPAVKADLADDVVNVIHDALNHNGRVSAAGLLEEFSEGGFAAVFIYFRRDFLLGIDQIAGEIK